ncbi:MAG: hypothetical protein ACRDV3_16510 [Acidothermaceae bacterium]
MTTKSVAVQRGRWNWRANALLLGYLLATVVLTVLVASGTVSRWLPLHTFLLGAATNAILVWSWHFATTLLHPKRSFAALRTPVLVTANVAIVGLLIGVSRHESAVVVVGAAVLGLAVVAQGAAVLAMSLSAQSSRFIVTVWFYLAALAFLLIGIAFGAVLAVGTSQHWYARLLVAHLHANVFGFVALTVVGTELGLWPMVLRTRIVAGAENALQRAAPTCFAGLALGVAGSVADSRVITALGLVGFIVGIAQSLVPFTVTAARRAPRTPASWMLTAATVWLLAALATDLAIVVRHAHAASWAGQLDDSVPWIVAGFVVQVFLGASTYLLPVVLGGGPTAGRRSARILDFGAPARIAGFNVGVGLLAFRLRGSLAVAGWCLVDLAVIGFVVLAATAIVAQLLSDRDAAARPQP